MISYKGWILINKRTQEWKDIKWFDDQTKKRNYSVQSLWTTECETESWDWVIEWSNKQTTCMCNTHTRYLDKSTKQYMYMSCILLLVIVHVFTCSIYLSVVRWWRHYDKRCRLIIIINIIFRRFYKREKNLTSSNTLVLTFRLQYIVHNFCIKLLYS